MKIFASAGVCSPLKKRLSGAFFCFIVSARKKNNRRRENYVDSVNINKIQQSELQSIGYVLELVEEIVKIIFRMPFFLKLDLEYKKQVNKLSSFNTKSSTSFEKWV